MNPSPDDDPAADGRQLGTLVTAGDFRQVSALVSQMNAQQLQPLAAGLDDRRRRWERAAKQPPRGHRLALLIAGAATRASAQATARWIAAPDLRQPDNHSYFLLRALHDRDPVWQNQVAHELATILGHNPWPPMLWDVVYGLSVMSGGAAPIADGFIRGWFAELAFSPATGRIRIHDVVRTAAKPPIRGQFPLPGATTLRERIGGDVFARQVLPRLFEIGEETPENADLPWRSAFRSDDPWPETLANLAVVGLIDRGTLIDWCLPRAARRDLPYRTAAFVQLLEELRPSQTEVLTRVPAYLRMLRDGPLSAALVAWRGLQALEEFGQISPEPILELSAALVSSGPGELVHIHLGWLDSVARRRPEHTGQVLRILTQALAHKALHVQERAASTIARHSVNVDRAELDELRSSIRTLNPRMISAALPHLGPQDAVAPEPADAPPGLRPPPIRPMPAPLESPAALAREFSTLLLATDCDGPQLERLLAGLVDLTATGHNEVADALAPMRLLHSEQWPPIGAALNHILDSILLKQSSSRPRSRHQRGAAIVMPSHLQAPDAILVARIEEIAAGLRLLTARTPAPCLLATPTHVSGLIDPPALIARMRRYESAKIEPWPLDFDQAILRLPAQADARTLADARLLKSRSGRDLYTHLSELESPNEPPYAGRGRTRPSPRPRLRLRRHPRAQAILPSLTALPTPRSRSAMRDSGPTFAYWPAIAPTRPDLIAAYAMSTLSPHRLTHARLAQLLPILAEGPDPFGPTTHLALAHILTDPDQRNRAAAVRALITLAARDQLDCAALGVEISSLMMSGIARTSFVIAAMDEATGAGAPGQVWSILAATLPALLLDGPSSDLPDFLAFCTRCAERAGARGSFPALDQLAARSGRERLLTEARRLRRTLVD